MKINAEIFGVKAIVGYDNSAAIQAAVDFSGNIEWPDGVLECSTVISVAKYPLDWSSSGLTNFKAVGSQTEVFDFTPAGTTYDAAGSKISGVKVSSDNSTPNQHGFKITKTLGQLSLDVSFEDITGYGIAFDPVGFSSGTMQNVSIPNASFLNVGGMIGCTEEPADGANMLFITMLSVDNINLDGTINPISPQPFMLDFRGIRHFKIKNLVTEGANDAAGTDVIMSLASNGYGQVDGWHNEWVTNKPTYLIKAFKDAENRWYGAKGADITLSDIVPGDSKIGVEDGADPHFTINNWIGYNETSIDDIIEATITTANKGPSFDFHGLSVKTPFTVPVNKRGYINIHSFRSADVGGSIHVLPTKIASWRPSMGSLVQYESAYLSPEVVTNSVSFSTIEPDTENDRILVERFDGIIGNPYYSVPMLKFGLCLEPEWLGSTVTMAIRYKMEVDPADVGQSTSFLYPNGNRVGTATIIKTANVYNEWTTAIMVFEPNTLTPKPYSRAIHLGMVNPAIIRIAAIDVYLGSGYAEPLDLDGA